MDPFDRNIYKHMMESAMFFACKATKDRVYLEVDDIERLLDLIDYPEREDVFHECMNEIITKGFGDTKEGNCHSCGEKINISDLCKPLHMMHAVIFHEEAFYTQYLVCTVDNVLDDKKLWDGVERIVFGDRSEMEREEK